MEEAVSGPAKRRLPLWLPYLVAAIAATISMYFVGSTLYRAEGDSRVSSFESAAVTEPDRVDIRGQILTVDLIKGEMTVRLAIRPRGDLVSPNGATLTRDLRVLVDTASGTIDRPLQKNRAVGAIDVPVAIYDGEPADYPFDRYESDLVLAVVTGDGADVQPVPVALSFDAASGGLAIDAGLEPGGPPGLTSIGFTIERSPTAKAVALFIMAVQWGLALIVLFVLIDILRGARKPELGMFSWLGAMLFAFPALRNASPGIPGIGTLSDYIAFFWAESSVAIALILIVAIWLFRPAK